MPGFNFTDGGDNRDFLSEPMAGVMGIMMVFVLERWGHWFGDGHVGYEEISKMASGVRV